MKRSISAILICSLIFAQPRLAFADTKEAEAALAKAKELKEAMHANYERDVRQAVGYAIDQHYTSLLLDMSALKERLGALASEGAATVASIARQQERLAAQITGGAEPGDAALASAIAKTAHLQAQMLRARQAASDQETLVQAWADRCSEQNREKTIALYDPLAMLLATPLSTLAIRANYEVSMSYGMDSRGSSSPQGSSFRASGGDLGEYDTAIVGVGTALLWYPPWGTVAGVVILVTWAVFRLGPILAEVGKVLAIQDEVDTIADDILRHQNDVITRVSGERERVASDSCSKTFPAGGEAALRSGAVADYVDASAAAYARALQINDQLRSAARTRYDRLRLIYFPTLLAEFANGARARQAADATVDARSRQIVSEVVRPMAERVRQSSGPEQWEAQQALWSQAIEMDARFRPVEGFSLQPEASAAPGAGATPAASRFWTVFGPRLKEYLR